MIKSKTIFLLLSLITAFGLSACAGGAESEAGNVYVSETAQNENISSDDFARAEEDIGKCMSSLIALNSDENTISVSSEDIFGASSEGGETAVFTDENGTLLRVRSVLFGSVGSVEKNYYFLDDGRGYYTVLEKHNDSAQLRRSMGSYTTDLKNFILTATAFLLLTG